MLKSNLKSDKNQNTVHHNIEQLIIDSLELKLTSVTVECNMLMLNI